MYYCKILCLNLVISYLIDLKLLVLCSVIFCCLSLDNILHNNLYPVGECPLTILLVRQPRRSEWVNKSTSTYSTPIVYTYSNVTGTHAGLSDRLCHPSVCQCVRGVTDSAGRVSRSGHPSVHDSFFYPLYPWGADGRSAWIIYRAQRVL